MDSSNTSACNSTIKSKVVESLHKTTISLPLLPISTNIYSQSKSLNSSLINESCNSCGGPLLRSFTGVYFNICYKMEKSLY